MKGKQMNRDLTQSERDTIEQIIDAACVDAVLQTVSEICNEKAEHIRSNWQDNDLAKLWDTAADAIDVASTHKAITRISL